MRSSVTSTLVLATLATGLASLYGCSSGDDGGGGGTVFPGGGSGSTAGSGTSAGNGSMAGSGTTAGSGNTTAGSGTGGSGTAGSATGGAGPTGGAGGSAPAGGSGGASGGSGGGGNPGGAITKVWKSDGCGKAAAVTSGQTAQIDTMGTKDAQCADKLNGAPKCGPWGQASSTWQMTPLKREFTVYLPQGYDMNKAYPLVFQGPGCGGDSTQVYPLNGNAGNTIIRVGLKPPPNSVGHGTNENQGCFDDKEGDDSLDWTFYETLYDQVLNPGLCFDRNRVFSAGNSSGSWFSNELGCKYAGDAKHPVRGVMPNTGGLPTETQYVPKCTTAPMAGMWIHETGDTTNPFSGNKVAIKRAMGLNKCVGATDYDDAVNKNMLENFPIGGGVGDDVCKKITGCDPLYPLVVCPLPGNGHGSHDTQANNGFSTFVKMFSAGPFLTQ